MTKWISVKDKMPSKQKNKTVITFEYLINLSGKKIPYIWMEDVKDLHKDEYGVWSDTGAVDITHWMPLPKPPEEL
tara:strand:- start:3548 stop:3772 length:225 start_codon:yes stop_codon:yes gene_type:complete